MSRITAHKIAALKPHPKNARIHSDRQLHQIAKSIETFGFTVPVLIDDKGVILAGHGRVAAAKKMGLETVPTIRIDDLSEAQKRAYIIADNRIAQLAGWDADLLADELKLLADEGLDFDLEATGFDWGEIDVLIAGGDVEEKGRAKILGKAARKARPGPEDRLVAPDTQHDYMGLWGYGAANGVFALHTRLYMETFGASREDFGRLCVAQRQNAMLNPNALLRNPLTMEDYLNGRPIADPLRLFDCVLPCCGADAVVLVSDKVARRLDVPKVRILGGGEVHNYPGQDIYGLSAGWETFRDRMWTQAGCAPADVDFIQLYDDYPVMEFIQLEGMGFAARGQAATLIRDNDCTVRGTLPINTGGGQLSAGQCGAGGGMIGVYEAVMQLRGEAGDRQVRNAKLGAVSGYGAVSYGRGLSASACILGR